LVGVEFDFKATLLPRKVSQTSLLAEKKRYRLIRGKFVEKFLRARKRYSFVCLINVCTLKDLKFSRVNNIQLEHVLQKLAKLHLTPDYTVILRRNTELLNYLIYRLLNFNGEIKLRGRILILSRHNFSLICLHLIVIIR
jgi:hypothetical protein